MRLDAINAWHLYSKWCFESLAIAEKFSERFGGEIVAAVVKASEGGVASAPRRCFLNLHVRSGLGNPRHIASTSALPLVP